MADELLALMKGNSPAEAKTEALPLMERLPPKIHKIQKELPAWIGADAGNKDKATALMQKLEEHLKAKNFEEAEKTADSILKMMGASAQAAAQDIPEEVRKKLRHDLGSSFLVFRDKVQEELKLTKEQKEKLEQHLRELLPDAMQFFQKIEGLKPEERKKELRSIPPKARKLAAVLKETLNEGQRTRLRQLELQREGLFGSGEIWKELQVTDEQRKQFMALIQQTQKKTQTLMEELQKGGNPEEIQPKVMKIREDLEGKLEALLTDAQKKQWKEMLGKPMDLGDLFDVVVPVARVLSSSTTKRQRCGALRVPCLRRGERGVLARRGGSADGAVRASDLVKNLFGVVGTLPQWFLRWANLLFARRLRRAA